jgi:hypothetical protein
MPLQIPTTKQLADQFLANYESEFGEEAPVHKKAFLRVIAFTEALIFTTLYKFGTQESLQNFALTANITKLKNIGAEYGVTQKPATFFKFNAKILLNTTWGDAEGNIVFPIGAEMISDSNGRRYINDAEHIVNATDVVNGYVILPHTAFVSSSESNLSAGATLTQTTPPTAGGAPGATDYAFAAATVDSIIENGIDEESTEAYRRRVLTEIRTAGGGGNSADYRRWAEETTGVNRAFPYAGKPTAWKYDHMIGGSYVAASSYIFFVSNVKPSDLGIIAGHFILVENSSDNDGIYRVTEVNEGLNRITVNETLVDETMTSPGSDITNLSLPGDRTVFIESTTDIDPDGIPTKTILDAARDTINIDPETLKARPPLGETDEFLFVEPITRVDVFVEVRGLSIDSTKEAAAKAEVQTAVTEHLRLITPFISGLDAEVDRNDKISDMTISQVIGDVLSSFGGFAEGVGVGLAPGVFVSSYQLTQGSLSKLGTITYV